MKLNSKRVYEVITIINTDTQITTDFFTLTLDEMLEGDSEVCYSLVEMLDEVLDMPEHCSMYFNPTRGSKADKGIIVRLK